MRFGRGIKAASQLLVLDGLVGAVFPEPRFFARGSMLVDASLHLDRSVMFRNLLGFVRLFEGRDGGQKFPSGCS